MLMSVVWTLNAVEAKVAGRQEFYACGTLSGEDSDMNVQATGIALYQGDVCHAVTGVLILTKPAAPEFSAEPD